MQSHQKNQVWDFWTGMWPFDLDISTGEFLLLSAVTDPPIQDDKQKNYNSWTLWFSHSNLKFWLSSQSTSWGSNVEPSSSEKCEHYVSPIEIRPFPKSGARNGARKRKSRLRAIWIDASVKAALKSEEEARCKRVIGNRLLTGSEGK